MMEEKHSKQLVEVIARSLVDNPDEVNVTEKRRAQYGSRASCGIR